MDGDWRTLAHAEQLLELRRYVEAESEFGRALTQDPSSPRALRGLGRALLGQGRLVDAERVSRRARYALGLDPHRADGHNLLGLCLASQGRRSEARAAYAEALALDPQHVLAQNNLAVTELERGGLARSAGLLRRAASNDPQERLVHDNLDTVLRGVKVRVAFLLFAGVQVLGTLTTMFDLTWWPRALLGLGWLAAIGAITAHVGRRLPRGLTSAGALWRRRGWRHKAFLVVVAVLATSLVLLSLGTASAVEGPAFAVALAGIIGWPVLIGGILGIVFPTTTTTTQHR